MNPARLITVGLLAAILGVSVAPAAENQKETGESLKYQCEGYDRLIGHATREFDAYNGPRCYGYIQGVTEALDGVAFCLPLITLAQKVQTVQSYLATHSPQLKDDAVKLVTAALAEVYPCAKR